MAEIKQNNLMESNLRALSNKNYFDIFTYAYVYNIATMISKDKSSKQ